MGAHIIRKRPVILLILASALLFVALLLIRQRRDAPRGVDHSTVGALAETASFPVLESVSTIVNARMAASKAQILDGSRSPSVEVVDIRIVVRSSLGGTVGGAVVYHVEAERERRAGSCNGEGVFSMEIPLDSGAVYFYVTAPDYASCALDVDSRSNAQYDVTLEPAGRIEGSVIFPKMADVDTLFPHIADQVSSTFRSLGLNGLRAWHAAIVSRL